MRVKHTKISAPLEVRGYKIRIRCTEHHFGELKFETIRTRKKADKGLAWGTFGLTFGMDLTYEQAWQLYAAIGKELGVNDY
jgi:hypothetical protein